MDIIGAIRSAPLIDLGLLLGLGLFVFLGVVQGAIRRLLGIASMLIAFILAANLRDPAGDYLSHNWTQFDLGYDRLLAFGIIFVVASVVASIAIQGLYKRTDLSTEHPVVEDVIGGLLGLLQGMVLLTVAVIILSSYPLPEPRPGDLTQVRDVQRMLVHESHIGGALRDHVAPPVVHIMGLLLPSDLVSIFP
ncbi:MAG: CvpA family protein [Candidatus Limnocylindrales bacterium]|jgi:uncharacterized membrane protein required for colicin V production